MIASEAAEINEMVSRATEAIGGRGTASVIHQELLAMIAEQSRIAGPLAHLVAYTSQKGLLDLIKSWMRTKGANGLPRMPEVNARHEHALVALFSKDEFKYVVGKQIESADARWGVVKKWAAEYEVVFGERLDINAIAAERRAA